ncbi:MAG: uridine kinase [Proteobacteria bacterium]|nr:uridine kinase [Pseudomonadota bacterium]
MKRLFIGITGGSGSGKTTVVRKIVENLPPGSVVVVPQDAYYKDNAHLSFEDRAKINYDHPFAFDNDLLITHINDLRDGKTVPQPMYSFITHSRLPDVLNVEPHVCVIVEGILILEDERLRSLLDIKVFVDTDADVRFIRRMRRDTVERGRSVDSVVDQYMSTVRPMHLQFIEPTRRYADVVVPEGGANDVAIDLLAARVHQLLG